MKKKSTGPVLIISSQPDTHADAVQKHLKKLGVPFVRFNSNEISEKSNIRYEMPPHDYIITSKGKEYRLSDFRSIWYRKPAMSWDDHTKISYKEGLQINYKKAEKINLIRNLMNEAKYLNINTISHLENMKKANNKLTQLRIAQQLGLKTPNTYIGSSLTELKNFLKKHPKSITKQLNQASYIEYGKYEMNLTTERFNLDFIKKHNVIIDYPIFIQEEIKKKFELRITIVGNKVFACRIDSQALFESSLDWRVINPKRIPHTKYKLPLSIKNACLKMCKLLELQFSAIDMAVTPDGEYIFFEINPNGQYLWIENLTKMPISGEIATFLQK